MAFNYKKREAEMAEMALTEAKEALDKIMVKHQESFRKRSEEFIRNEFIRKQSKISPIQSSVTMKKPNRETVRDPRMACKPKSEEELNEVLSIYADIMGIKVNDIHFGMIRNDKLNYAEKEALDSIYDNMSMGMPVFAGAYFQRVGDVIPKTFGEFEKYITDLGFHEVGSYADTETGLAFALYEKNGIYVNYSAFTMNPDKTNVYDYESNVADFILDCDKAFSDKFAGKYDSRHGSFHLPAYQEGFKAMLDMLERNDEYIDHSLELKDPERLYQEAMFSAVHVKPEDKSYWDVVGEQVEAIALKLINGEHYIDPDQEIVINGNGGDPTNEIKEIKEIGPNIMD